MSEARRYFSLKPALSRGAQFTFVTGNRSAGKTYSFKEWCLTSWIAAKREGKPAPEWMYVRRVKAELAGCRNLWDDIAYKFGYVTRSKGMYCEIRRLDAEDDEPWERFGYYVALSEQQSLKGTPFPLVDKICFDEFIIENPRQRYIPNEPDFLTSLHSTVARDRRNVRVVCLSNAGALNNPYFVAYGVTKLDILQSAWIRRNEGKVLFHNFVLEMDLDTGAWSERYRTYAQSNMYLDDDDWGVVDRTPRDLRPSCTVDIAGRYVEICHSGKAADGLAVHVPIYARQVESPRVLPVYNWDKEKGENPFHKGYVKWVQSRMHLRLVSFDSIETKFLLQSLSGS